MTTFRVLNIEMWSASDVDTCRLQNKKCAEVHLHLSEQQCL